MTPPLPSLTPSFPAKPQPACKQPSNGTRCPHLVPSRCCLCRSDRHGASHVLALTCGVCCLFVRVGVRCASCGVSVFVSCCSLLLFAVLFFHAAEGCHQHVGPFARYRAKLASRRDSTVRVGMVFFFFLCSRVWTGFGVHLSGASPSKHSSVPRYSRSTSVLPSARLSASPPPFVRLKHPLMWLLARWLRQRGPFRCTTPSSMPCWWQRRAGRGT